MVALFVISITPTAQTIQKAKPWFIRKTEEGRKLTHDPNAYQISELKNGNFYTIFVVKICSVRLLTFCVLTVMHVNVYWIHLNKLHSDKRIPPPAGVHYYLCVSPSVRAYLCNSWKCYNSWTTWYILIKLCIILQRKTSNDKAYIFPSWHDNKHQILKLPLCF